MIRFLSIVIIVVLAGCSEDDAGGGGGENGGGGGAGDSAVLPGAARTGNFGYRVTLDEGHVFKPLDFNEAPANPSAINYGFCLGVRANDVLSDGDVIEVANASNSNDEPQVKVMLEGQGGQNQIRFAARKDDGTFVTQGTSTPFPPGYNLVQARWSAPGQYLRTSVNDVPTPELSNLDNANQQIDKLQVGVIAGSVDPTTEVSIDFDDVAQEFLAQFDPLTVTEGLNPGTSITFTQLDTFFFSTNPFCSVGSGGALGGGIVTTRGAGIFDVTGTGELATFSRTLSMSFCLVVDTAQPASTTGPVVSIPNLIDGLLIELIGDPDFQFLRIRSGSELGLSSPGTTTLTRVAGGNFEVDSFFDITYEIEFNGDPGGALAGYGNSDPDPESPSTLELDLNPGGVDQLIFADGFESGDTSAWSN